MLDEFVSPSDGFVSVVKEECGAAKGLKQNKPETGNHDGKHEHWQDSFVARWRSVDLSWGEIQAGVGRWPRSSVLSHRWSSIDDGPLALGPSVPCPAEAMKMHR